MPERRSFHRVFLRLRGELPGPARRTVVVLATLMAVAASACAAPQPAVGGPKVPAAVPSAPTSQPADMKAEPTSLPANLLVNPGFEDGDTGWSAMAGNKNWGKFEIVDSPVRSGKKAAHLPVFCSPGSHERSVTVLDRKSTRLNSSHRL